MSGDFFYWSMSPDTFKAGSDVTFDVTSNDVNHGLSVYDPDRVLVGNVQAMPGYQNQRPDPRQPGTTMLACLEYCGYKHHER